jgi:hypothetical protein
VDPWIGAILGEKPSRFNDLASLAIHGKPVDAHQNPWLQNFTQTRTRGSSSARITLSSLSFFN